MGTDKDKSTNVEHLLPHWALSKQKQVLPILSLLWTHTRRQSSIIISELTHRRLSTLLTDTWHNLHVSDDGEQVPPGPNVHSEFQFSLSDVVYTHHPSLIILSLWVSLSSFQVENFKCVSLETQCFPIIPTNFWHNYAKPISLAKLFSFKQI